LDTDTTEPKDSHYMWGTKQKWELKVPICYALPARFPWAPVTESSYVLPPFLRREHTMSRENAILALLKPSDKEALSPHLHKTNLQSKQILFEIGDTVSSVYFPVDAVVSLVVGLSAGQMTESAMVGNDGLVGAASALDGKIALCRGIVQLPGEAFVCDAEAFRGTALQSENLISIIIRHEQSLFAQAQQSTACMANHTVEARLCRWMLRARDLSGSNDLPFTQEFLAEMLGVIRTSVSTVAHTLQQAGLIKYTRGRIQILNVDGLQQCACECYETVKAQYAALLEPARRD
jgi:CRP-like cAMP-binding protein